jgi:TATA-box binding protein (TBP) (component of TFIID and TFIIIB)
VGDAFTKFARSNKGYQNFTGNLESSIGYVILKDGRIIVQNFEAAGTGTDRESGVRKAEAMAQQLKDDYPSGYILLGFAAEEYALLVESQGKDVVTGAYTKAKADLKKAIATIKRKL